MKDAYKKSIIYGIGSVFMWYSYTLFMPFFLIISGEFFPCEDKVLNMIIGFSVFGLGLISRPIGSYIFGKIGDSVCRETSMGISLTLLSVSTIFMGCIPSYSKCGLASSILLTIARVVQGIAMGGSGNISMVQIVEIVPDNKKGLVGCIPNAANLAGLLISNLVFSYLYFNVPDLHTTIWWRVPFWIGAVLLLFAMIQFKSATCHMDTKAKQAVSICSIFQKYRSELICVFLLTAFSATCYYMAFAFLPNYMLSHFEGNSVNVVSYMNFFLLIAIFVCGHLSDKFGINPVLISAFLIILSISLVMLCIPDQYTAARILICSLGISLSIYYSVSGAFFTSLFPKGVRCTAIAVSMSLSQAIFGGLIPVIATKLTSYSFYLVIMPLLMVSICSLLIVIFIKRRKNGISN